MNLERPPMYPELAELADTDVVVSTLAVGPIRGLDKVRNKTIIYSNQEMIQDHLIEKMASSNRKNLYIFVHVYRPGDEVLAKYKDCVHFIQIKNAYAHYAKNIDYQNIDFNKIISTPKTKHFLSLNSRASWFRQGLFYFFENYQLRDKAYFSYIGNNHRTQYSSIAEIDQEFSAGVAGNVWYANRINLEECRKLVPVYTGLDDNDNMLWGLGNSRYYEDCFCSIVTETHSFEPKPFFSEKIFKPILCYQPFLMHSNPDSYAYLRDLGFKTFENWFDQSYDSLIGRQRFEAMLHVILEISQWPIEKVNRVYQEMLPVLEHNHNHFTKTLPLLYNKEIVEVKQQIKDIITNK